MLKVRAVDLYSTPSMARKFDLWQFERFRIEATGLACTGFKQATGKPLMGLSIEVRARAYTLIPHREFEAASAELADLAYYTQGLFNAD